MDSVLDTWQIGQSQNFRAALRRLEQISTAHCPVLVTGETGTGKELVAKAIHHLSSRSRGPLVIANCAAILAHLAESEFFGHERGAFTGATSRFAGKFASAHSGTILLDEVGEMPLELQAKVLRAVETGELERLGNSTGVKVDVRVIATSNRDLRAEVEAGRFRSDLFFRLNVAQIALPPLRERGNDVMLLACFFLDRFNNMYSKKIDRFSRDAIRLLNHYHWPGNVRELEHAMERAVMFSENGFIAAGDLGIVDSRPEHPRRARQQAELDFIRGTLMRNEGNVTKTAKECGYSREGLYYRLKKENIDPACFRPGASSESQES